MSRLKDRRIIMLRQDEGGGSYRVANYNIYIFKAGKYWVVREYDLGGDMVNTDKFNSFKAAKTMVADRIGL